MRKTDIYKDITTFIRMARNAMTFQNVDASITIVSEVKCQSVIRKVEG